MKGSQRRVGAGARIRIEREVVGRVRVGKKWVGQSGKSEGKGGREDGGERRERRKSETHLLQLRPLKSNGRDRSPLPVGSNPKRRVDLRVGNDLSRRNEAKKVSSSPKQVSSSRLIETRTKEGTKAHLASKNVTEKEVVVHGLGDDLGDGERFEEEETVVFRLSGLREGRKGGRRGRGQLWVSSRVEASASFELGGARSVSRSSGGVLSGQWRCCGRWQGLRRGEGMRKRERRANVPSCSSPT